MGNQIDRRKFLKLSTAGCCGSVAHRVMAPMGGLMAFAGMPGIAQAMAPDSVFIIVNMAGGASHNWAPVDRDDYRAGNPTIGYTPAQYLPLNNQQGLHPSLTALKAIYDEGHLAMFNQVGYAGGPNRSHAESTDIWNSGFPNGMGSMSQGGWAARLTCEIAGIFAGISLGGTTSLMEGGCNDGRTFGDLNSFGENSLFYNDDLARWLRLNRDQAIQKTIEVSPNMSYAKRAIDNIEASIDTIKAATNITLPGPAFPNSGFGNSCRDAAKLVASSSTLNTRFVYLERGGFDTHQGERAAMTANLNDMNAGLAALIGNLKALGKWNNVVIATMTEFCRTRENGSQGTDHGHATPLVVMGGSVVGGVKNGLPQAGTFLQDYISNIQIDNRTIFWRVIEGMGLDPSKVFPGFAPDSYFLF